MCTINYGLSKCEETSRFSYVGVYLYYNNTDIHFCEDCLYRHCVLYLSCCLTLRNLSPSNCTQIPTAPCYMLGNRTPAGSTAVCPVACLRRLHILNQSKLHCHNGGVLKIWTDVHLIWHVMCTSPEICLSLPLFFLMPHRRLKERMFTAKTSQ